MRTGSTGRFYFIHIASIRRDNGNLLAVFVYTEAGFARDFELQFLCLRIELHHGSRGTCTAVFLAVVPATAKQQIIRESTHSDLRCK